MLHSLPTHTPSPNTPYTAHMGYQNSPYLLDPSLDSAAVDFRAFYPYTPNEVKHRKRTTSAQLKVLETIFKKDTKPNANLRNELASELDMSARGVQVWFQNRRAKEKLKAGKSSPGSKGPGSTSPSSPIDFSKQELSAIKDETISSDSINTSADAQDHFDAYSQSPSPSITSPPQLHLVTDASNFCWNSSPVEPPDSDNLITRQNMFPGTTDFYSHRRGSLPVNAFPLESSSESRQLDCFDPLVRRRSIDASLHRLASNPFASLARAKNSALYGPGFGVSLPGSSHHQLNHLPYGHPSQRRGLSQLAAMPQHASLRRLSMDSRSTRVLSRLNQSPSPSPLTPYNAVVRASLPDHLFTVTSRTVVAPIPGPLPSPGFSFGAASTPSMTSPSSGDSERNSPDSLQSFTFLSEDKDEEGALSHYEVYSRFGSIASIATSDSSSYFSELGNSAVDHLATSDIRAEDRRSSCSSGQFLGLISGLDVNSQVEHTQNSLNLASYSPHEDYSYARANDGVELINSHEMHQQQQQTEGSYPSPASTISPRGTPHSRDPAVPISTSSELAFALESKPTDQVQPGSRQESYMAYDDHHHQNHLSGATATSHGHAHGVVERSPTDHDEVDYYTQQHQHETQSADATSVYHQETDCNVFNPHGHYLTSPYSSLSDAYPGSTDHQMNCIGGSVMATYPPSAYGETLSSVLGHGASSLNSVIQPVETFASYST